MTIERVGDTPVLRPIRPHALERLLAHRDAHLAAQPDDRFSDRDQPARDDGAVNGAPPVTAFLLEAAAALRSRRAGARLTAHWRRRRWRPKSSVARETIACALGADASCA